MAKNMSFSGLRFCILILIPFISFRITEAQPLYHFCLYEKGYYTANSTYQANFDRVLSSFSNAENDHGFYNMSAGNNSDTVNAIALCRGDVKPNDCLNCISNAASELKRRCPNQKEAIIWYDYCMFRYSNRSIFGIMETGDTFYKWNFNNVPDVDGFNKALSGLLSSLRSIAASGGSLRKFAAANARAPDFQTIYALVQCTPDLSETDCNDCLVKKFGHIPVDCCQGKRGGRVLGPSCNFRYELWPFYDPSVSTPIASPPANPASSPPPAIPASLSPPSTNTTPSEEGNGRRSNTIIIIVISTTVPAILIICVCFCGKSKNEVESVDEVVREIRRAGSLQYDFGTIRVATNNFSNANKLGEGGFGAVYKGTFPNGQEVAIRRLSKKSSQGELEFKNEALLLAKLHHRNLVRLMGFCHEREERVLIYEFMPNSSLNNFLSDYDGRAQLDWGNRYNIIHDIAQGLFYLHEESQHQIIHRNLNPRIILLDAVMDAKISGFGNARLFSADQTQDDTSKIVGTYGYMAPEYILYGRYSAKSDVYCFGVIVLEVVSGQKNVRFPVETEDIVDLTTYTWQIWNQGAALDLIDPTLVGPTSEMMRCIHIGLLCVQENEANRPTIASVGVMLSNDSMSLPQPSKPAFFVERSLDRETSSSMEHDLESIESDQSNTNSSHLNDSIGELDPR